MTDEQNPVQPAPDPLRGYHPGDPVTYRIDIEYHDGSDGRYSAQNIDEAWHFIAWLDRRGGFKSAWRDGEPWLGDCTRDDLP